MGRSRTGFERGGILYCALIVEYPFSSPIDPEGLNFSLNLAEDLTLYWIGLDSS
jgi:hypothetical protein